MNIIAVDDEKLALETLVDSTEKVMPGASIHGFCNPQEAVERALKHLRTPVKPQIDKKIRFQCFGTFEVFFGEEKLVFKRGKAKELLAYLVDRMGASVTMGELMSVLWEDGRDTISRKSNLRHLISDVKQTFAEVGSEDIIIKSRNTIALNYHAVDCDFYDFLRHIPYAVNAYRGEYMTQYSWAEITTASLTQFK